MTVGQLGQGGTWPDFQKIDIKCSLRLLQCSGELHRHQHLFNPVVRCGESVGTDVRAGYGFPYAFVNLLNPVYAYVTALFGRNIFWADGSYTNIFGKTKAGKPAGAPEEAHAKALANLEARRAAGKAPKINA